MYYVNPVQKHFNRDDEEIARNDRLSCSEKDREQMKGLLQTP
jgi:hypothetical protein